MPFTQPERVSHTAVVLVSTQACPFGTTLGHFPFAEQSPTRHRTMVLHDAPALTQVTEPHSRVVVSQPRPDVQSPSDVQGPPLPDRGPHFSCTQASGNWHCVASVQDDPMVPTALQAAELTPNTQ